MSDTITIHVRCFSHVKQALQTDTLDLELPAGATTADAGKQLQELAKGQLDSVPFRMAVNKNFVNADHTLQNNDELALIPPVQGG